MRDILHSSFEEARDRLNEFAKLQEDVKQQVLSSLMLPSHLLTDDPKVKQAQTAKDEKSFYNEYLGEWHVEDCSLSSGDRLEVNQEDTRHYENPRFGPSQVEALRRHGHNLGLSHTVDPTPIPNPPIRPKIDVNTELANIKNLTTQLANALGVPAPDWPLAPVAAVQPQPEQPVETPPAPSVTVGRRRILRQLVKEKNDLQG